VVWIFESQNSNLYKSEQMSGLNVTNGTMSGVHEDTDPPIRGPSAQPFLAQPSSALAQFLCYPWSGAQKSTRGFDRLPAGEQAVSNVLDVTIHIYLLAS
jgi:hypothetical protein